MPPQNDDIEKQEREDVMQRLRTFLNNKERDKYDSRRYLDKDTLFEFAKKMKSDFFDEQELDHLPEDRQGRYDLYEEFEKQNKEYDPDILEKNPGQYDPDEALRKILDEIGIYVKLDVTANRSKILKNREVGYYGLSHVVNAEGNLVALINKQLQTLQQYLESHPIAPEENARDDLKVYRNTMILGLADYFDGQVNGTLGKDPAFEEQPEDEHYTYVGHFMENSKGDDAVTFSESEEDENKFLEDINKDLPLFPHTPSAQDVQQGHVGDCYFVSVLAAVADKHPDKIKDMMHDNGDGTVKVRLFYEEDHQFKPFYVTVEKAVNATQAAGSMWVQTLERAYAASGILRSHKVNKMEENGRSARPVPTNIDQIYEDFRQKYPDDKDFRMHVKMADYPWLYDNAGNITKWVPDFSLIRSSTARMAFQLLLGQYAEVNHESMYEDGMHDIIPEKDSDVKDVDLNRPYTDKEKAVFEKLEHACNSKDKVVTAGTYHPKEGNHVKLRGISKKHEYTVLGAEHVYVDGKDRLFIKLRNPHGAEGRTYVKSSDTTLRAVENTKIENSQNARDNGFCYVELSDFVKEFYGYTIAEIKNPVRKIVSEADKEKKALQGYEKAFKDIRKLLTDTDRRMSRDSDEYKDLKKELWKLTDHFPKTFDELKEKIGKLENLLTEYTAHTRRIKRSATNVRRNVKLNCRDALNNLVQDIKSDKVVSPQILLLNKASNQIMKDFADSSSDQANDKTAYESMQKKAKSDPDKAKKQLVQSDPFKKWYKNNSKDYITLYNAVQKGVTVREVAPAEVFRANKLQRSVFKVKEYRELLKERYGEEQFKAKAENFRRRKQCEKEEAEQKAAEEKLVAEKRAMEAKAKEEAGLLNPDHSDQEACDALAAAKKQYAETYKPYAQFNQEHKAEIAQKTEIKKRIPDRTLYLKEKMREFYKTREAQKAQKEKEMLKWTNEVRFR